MRKYLYISTLFLVYLAYCLYISTYDFRVLVSQIKPAHPNGLYDYRGVTHVQTNLSQGSSPHEEILVAAQKANLDFIIFTDLNQFSQSPNVQKYHGNVLTLLENKYSYLDSHLLLYQQNASSSFPSLGEAQVSLTDHLSQERTEESLSQLILAHPFKSGYQWNGPLPSGLDGIEVINLKSTWQQSWQGSKFSFLWSALIYPFNSKLALLRLYREPKRELQLWEQLNQKRHTVGFLGNHTTARAIPIGRSFFRFPSYETSFSFASNHVVLKAELTGNYQSDRLKLLHALKKGQFYMSLDLIANPVGFNAFVQGENENYLMGSKIPLSDNLELIVSIPSPITVPYEIVILRNGKREQTFNATQGSMRITQPGVYKVIVRVIPTLPLPDGKRWFTWIHSNPFYVENNSALTP